MEIVSVDEAEPPADKLIEPGLRDGWGPEGETAEARVTDPEKPFTLVKVMVAVADDPSAVSDVALGRMVKSGTDDVGLNMTKLPNIEVGWIVQ